mmetsp:Transcript_10926/g.40108  ORF Transcript_10926/g.40108 Transcript_10926/m.40108 type:complete len:273 (+) Transcript_10926:288-1106(+)
MLKPPVAVSAPLLLIPKLPPMGADAPKVNPPPGPAGCCVPKVAGPVGMLPPNGEGEPCPKMDVPAGSVAAPEGLEPIIPCGALPGIAGLDPKAPPKGAAVAAGAPKPPGAAPLELPNAKAAPVAGAALAAPNVKGAGDADAPKAGLPNAGDGEAVGATEVTGFEDAAPKVKGVDSGLPEEAAGALAPKVNAGADEGTLAAGAVVEPKAKLGAGAGTDAALLPAPKVNGAGAFTSSCCCAAPNKAVEDGFVPSRFSRAASGAPNTIVVEGVVS